MFKNYMKIALRNLQKHKGYAAINIGGLAIGIACCILISLYVHFELSYDRYHKHAGSIYRVAMDYKSEDRSFQTPILVASMGPVLKEEFPEVEEMVRLFTYSWKETALVTIGEKHFYEGRFFLADKAFFDVFSCEFIKGDPRVALQAPNSIVITEDTAKKYFGEDEPIGKILSVTNLGRADFQVTGVVKDVPANSHLKFDLLAPLESGESLYWKEFTQGWRGSSFYTYVKLSAQTKPSDFEAKLPLLVDKYLKGDRNSSRLYLQSLTKIHLHSHMGSDELEPGNSWGNLYFFILIVLFILALACINYINLATARSSKRAKEVGLRKVVGANKNQLIRQFLGESMLFSFLAFPVAMLLAEVLLPTFNRIVGRELSLLSLNNLWVLVMLLGVAVGVGAVSGSYPAFLISSFQPVRIIRGLSSASSSKSMTRNILVVVQFAISIAFIFITVVTKQQLSFIRDKNAGFNKEHVVVLPIKDYESTQSYPVFKNELLENPDILFVTASRQLPSSIRFKQLVEVDGKITDEEIRMDWNGVDFDFIETYGIEVIEGRNFDRNRPADAASAYILNETAVKSLGWTSALGKKFQLSNEGLARAEFTPGEIIGVVKDFHFQSFHSSIEPLVLKIRPIDVNFVSARIRSDNVSGVLSFIKLKWEKINPTRPFEYFFFDDHFNRMYRTEADLQNIFRYSSVLAILIASLGVFGLASFKVEQRTKEIGIRKILGASASKIILLLSGDFVRLVLIANVIAWPVGYFVMHRWLQDYAYRVGIGWQAFVFSAILALAVALITISYQSIKAAVANPSKALRYE